MTDAIRTTEQARNLEFISFGIADSKGREIGIRIARETVAVIDIPANHRGNFLRLSFAPIGGQIFSVCATKTLNGAIFGASQGTSYFATIEEADAFAAKRIADSRKKAGA